MRRKSDKPINFSLFDNGRIKIGSNLIEIRNLNFIEHIGTGANSIVFKAKHKYLENFIAVKIWLKIKTNDRRDKFIQGVEEAKKAFSIKESHVVRMYDADKVNDFFYATMEYYPWITVKEWLKECSPKLATRWNLSRHICKSMISITNPTSFHGDLHTGNILVSAIPKKSSIYFRERTPDFVIIDFGTSIFSSKEYSIKRHWRIFENTIDHLLYPIKIDEVWVPYAGTRPENFSERCGWYHVYIEEIPYMLGFLGADWASLPISFAIEKFPDKTKEALSKLVKKGLLVLDKETLGDYGDWHEDIFNQPYVYGEGM